MFLVKTQFLVKNCKIWKICPAGGMHPPPPLPCIWACPINKHLPKRVNLPMMFGHFSCWQTVFSRELIATLDHHTDWLCQTSGLLEKAKISCNMTKPTKWLCIQWRFRSAWVDAQADLSLRWAHTHFVGFVMLRLSWDYGPFRLL